MAAPAPAKYYEAYKAAYPKLIRALPIDDILPDLVAGGVLPGKLKARMDAITISSDKVKLMLDEMEGGLKAQIPDQFESLISVMETFAEDEGHIVVKKLVSDIRATLASGTPNRQASTEKITKQTSESTDYVSPPAYTPSSPAYTPAAPVVQQQHQPLQLETDMQQLYVADSAVPNLCGGSAQIRWKEGAPAPFAGIDHVLVVYNGAIYCGGGSTKDGPLFTVYVYNPDTNTWGPPIDTPHKLFGMAVIMDKLVIVGGRPVSGDVTAKVLYLDRGRWYDYTEMPTARSACFACTRQSNMIVMGGWDGHNELRTTEVYDNAIGQWFRCTDLPIPLYDLDAIVLGDVLFVINGNTTGGDFTLKTYATSLNTLSSRQLKWQALADTPQAAMCGTGAGNKYLLCVGGRTKTGSVCVLQSDGTSLTDARWKVIGSIPAVHYYTAAICMGNQIFVISGKDYETEMHNGVSIGTFY